MKRRKFLKLTGRLAALGALTGLYTWQVEPFWLQFVKKKMPIKNLPSHLEGKILLQISDMHIGSRFDWKYIISSFKKAQKLSPDFVVYTGDFIHYQDNYDFSQLERVFEHVVKGKLGTVGVLGNHDYGINWSEEHVAKKTISYLEKAGVSMLRNNKREYNGLHITGIDDYWGTNFKPQSVLPSLNNQKANLVLCHNPDACDLDIWHNYKGWILSGHTHGGQCKPPFLSPPILPVKNKRYTAGEIDLHDGRTLYINRALGHSFQVRFNVRPEITVFKLEHA